MSWLHKPANKLLKQSFTKAKTNDLLIYLLINLVNGFDASVSWGMVDFEFNEI